MKTLRLFNPLFWIGTGGTIGQGTMWVMCDSVCGDKTYLMHTFWVVLMFIGFALSYGNIIRKKSDDK